MRPTYLITGATGFIGSVLTRRLVASSENIHLLLRPQAKIWRIKDILSHVVVHDADLSDGDHLTRLIKSINPSIIYHLAANGAYPNQNQPDQIIETNIMGTWNLLKACQLINYHLFVNTGSSSEYGFKNKPMQESDLLEPNSYYAVSKCATTLLCSQHAKETGKPIVTLRPFSVYGPYEEPSRFVPTLLSRLSNKKPMNLVNPETVRDYIYVDDLVRAYLSISQLVKYPGEYFNIGSGLQYTIKEVVNLAVKVTGQSTTFNWGKMPPRTWDTSTWVADITKTKTKLDWTPQITLEAGLKQTWTWFQSYPHSLYA
jgi:nucleoside-diphosphate-sugar epimerase